MIFTPNIGVTKVFLWFHQSVSRINDTKYEEFIIKCSYIYGEDHMTVIQFECVLEKQTWFWEEPLLYQLCLLWQMCYLHKATTIWSRSGKGWGYEKKRKLAAVTGGKLWSPAGKVGHLPIRHPNLLIFTLWTHYCTVRRVCSLGL